MVSYNSFIYYKMEKSIIQTIAFESVSSEMECQTRLNYNPWLFCQQKRHILKKSPFKGGIIELTIKSYRPHCALFGVYGFQAL